MLVHIDTFFCGWEFLQHQVVHCALPHAFCSPGCDPLQNHQMAIVLQVYDTDNPLV